MKLAIMQPYWFPYIGYFQLIHAADKFVVYDNIEFTKKGWIHRNRILVNGHDDYITLPLKKDSDYLQVQERKLAGDFKIQKEKLLRKIKENYRKAPEFNTVFPLIELVMNTEEDNLFRFIFRSLQLVCNFLDINTQFIVSSTLPVTHGLKGQEKVLAICKALHATHYLNPPGGIDLYSKETFTSNNIDLNFINPKPCVYKQFTNGFVPWLSIIDVLMFNSKEKVQEFVRFNYTII